MNGRNWIETACHTIAAIFIAWGLAFALGATGASAAQLDTLDLERWKILRETERYQLNIAEKYYKEQNWKVALSEYEKFLTLYEMSEGASYAQLKWAICKLNLRLANEAIKEGFQSVIDYWPESNDAVIAAYFIGRTYKDMGELKKAKVAYQQVAADYPKNIVAAYALQDLVDISIVEEDVKTRVALWKQLAYEFPREGQDAIAISNKACHDLAVHSFWTVTLDEAIKALGRVYAERDIPHYLVQYSATPLQGLTNEEKTRDNGRRLAMLAVGYIREKTPTDLTKEADKNLARQYWFYQADLLNYARIAEEVPKHYDAMLAKFGEEDAIYQRLGDWYKSQGKWEESRNTYNKFKDRIAAQGQIALSFRHEHKIEQAIEAYRRLSLQDTEHAAKWVAEVAQTLYEHQRYKEAVPIYEELIGIDAPNSNSWRRMVAYSYQHAGMYPEAIGNWRQVDAFPENYQQMAGCHRALGQFGEAVLLYNQIIGGAPGTAPWAQLEVARTYEQAGNKEKAIRAYQTVCDKYPGDGHASAAHNYLKEKFKIDSTKGGAVQGN